LKAENDPDSIKEGEIGYESKGIIKEIQKESFEVAELEKRLAEV